MSEPPTHAADRLKPGMFVTVRIKGRQVENVHRLPRHLVYDGDTVFLAINDQLNIRSVTILRRFKKSVLISGGLSNGDLVITTPLSDAVQQYVADNRDRMPANIQLATCFDLSTLVRDHIDRLLRNGFQGIVLVFIGQAIHERVRGHIEKGLQFTIDRIYTPTLRYVVENRYFTLSIGVGVLIVSLGILRGGYVPFIFMPKGGSDWVIAEVNYPLGTPVETTAQTIAYLEQQAIKLNQTFKGQLDEGKTLITNTYSLTGFIPRRDWKPQEIGGHCGEVWIEMISSAERPRLSVHAVINQWRTLAGEVPGLDRKRVITVSSDIDEDIGNASTIVTDLKADFLPRLMNRYPGLRYDLEGQEKRTQESLGSLKKGFTLALMAIFLLLATQFRSYVQPVIIMLAIPFGLIGAIGGHLVMGLAFTIISIFGLLAATLLTLLYVPALYLIVDDVIRGVKKRLGWGRLEEMGGKGLDPS